MFSIYGKQLGAAGSCVRDAGSFLPDGPNSREQLAAIERTLPVSLCGVQVLIDEEPVPLIYVQEKQINFVVPVSRSFGDRVMLRVVRDGIGSIPVAVKFGPDRIWLYQDQQAQTGMPVWIRLYQLSDSKLPVELPFGIPRFWPRDCPQIELKYGGVLLAPLETKNRLRMLSYSGPPCPAPAMPDRQSLAGRFPLHLRYRMDRPGTYYARYLPGSGVFGGVAAATDWTPVELKPGSAVQRREWLLRKRRSAPTDRESLLYDFLPSIFGYGDPETLRIGLPYLYHSDPSVRGAAAEYLRNYHSASELIPALENIEQQRGRNRILEQLLIDLGAKTATRR
jgi:hypothetical protein